MKDEKDIYSPAEIENIKAQYSLYKNRKHTKIVLGVVTVLATTPAIIFTADNLFKAPETKINIKSKNHETIIPTTDLADESGYLTYDGEDFSAVCELQDGVTTNDCVINQMEDEIVSKLETDEWYKYNIETNLKHKYAIILAFLAFAGIGFPVACSAYIKDLNRNNKELLEKVKTLKQQNRM